VHEGRRRLYLLPGGYSLSRLRPGRRILLRELVAEECAGRGALEESLLITTDECR
jgi:hypothetical protein